MNENQINERDPHLHDFLKNNRDMIPQVCYYKNDSDFNRDIVDELTIFSHIYRKSDINKEFISNLIHFEKNAFIFCDCKTLEEIVISLHRHAQNNNIISEPNVQRLIELNDTYGYFKMRNVVLDKIT